LGQRRNDLCQREGEAHEIGRLLGDKARCRIHDHHRHLGLGAERRHRQRVGRQAEASEELDVLARQQLLRLALGLRRIDAAGVALEDDDLPAGDGVAVLLHEDRDALHELVAEIGEGAGEGREQADLDRVHRRGLGGGTRQRQERERGGQRGAPKDRVQLHRSPLPIVPRARGLLVGCQNSVMRSCRQADVL
jgi:hypothetical protein